ncbi:MAG: endonuclease MutS2, partial [Bacillota bacterium]|nr:endonuclease MutS2 [Bacillota bacterium]
MKEKILQVLEYGRIIDRLKEQAGSEMAKKAISELKPVFDVEDIRQRQQETTEAVRLISARGSLPIGGITDIHGLVSFAVKGGTLTMAQLLRVMRQMKTARDVVTFMKGEDVPELPLLSSIVGILAVHRQLAERIDACILSEDEMADSASSELRSIRRAILRQNEALRAKMNQILNSADNRNILQDAIVTIRNGRYVVPVKQEHRSGVPGIVHDQSGSGQTLFIEPQAIVNMNNELRQLELDEQAEIDRILREFSEAVAELHYDLENNQKLLVLLDTFMARGRLSIAMDGEEPEIAEDGVLDLQAAVHPLLDRDQAVPGHISIGGEYRTLVVTGPNTGGKTVTLKTAGLLTLMAQAGLHIPAAAGSRIPVFRQVFADIGDEQSIEQSLSTFSSHMSNIVEIVKEADGESLVLLDELGAGTDPAEGAALAIAILEELSRRGACTLATTHYTELKKYAIAAEGVENASMEFDVKTLRPTYRLTIGLPGKSNAFEIASRLGIPASFTQRAGQLLDTGDVAFDEVIGSLEEDKKQVEQEREEARRMAEEMRWERERLQEEIRAQQARQEKELAEAREEAREIVREAKEVSDEIRRELKELSRLENLSEANRRHDASRRRLRQLEKKNRPTIRKEENTAPVDPDKLKVGDRVKVLTIGQNGEILELPDERGELMVQVGMMKVNAHVDDIMLIDRRRPASRPGPRFGGSGHGSLRR